MHKTFRNSLLGHL